MIFLNVDFELFAERVDVSVNVCVILAQTCLLGAKDFVAANPA